MKFRIIQNKNTFLAANFYIPELVGIVIILFLIIYSLFKNIPLNEPLFYLLFITFLLIYVLKEEFLTSKLYNIIGDIYLEKYIELKYFNKTILFNYSELEYLSINYDNYRHWLNEEYVFKISKGTHNFIKLRTKDVEYNFFFLSASHKDEKKLRLFCYQLKRNGVPIEYIEKGKTIIERVTKNKVSN